MAQQANDNMTPAEQVDFAWRHRAYFAEVATHNMAMNVCRVRGDMTGKFRNAWAELFSENDNKPLDLVSDSA